MARTVFIGSKKGFFRLNGNGEIEERSLDGLEVADLMYQSEDDRLFAATRGEGVLVSRDRGETWDRRGEAAMAKSMALGQHSGQPNVIYAGTEPAAIWKSTDDGDSWTQLGDLSACSASRGWSYPVKGIQPHIRSVDAGWDNDGTVYGAVQVGGVVRSTDSGQTWADFRNLDLDVHTIRVHPTKTDTVFAAAGHSGAYRSTDGGDTWTLLSEGCGSFGYDVAFHPANPDVLFFVAGVAEPPFWVSHPDGARAFVYRSTDGGDHWSATDVGNPKGTKLMLYELAFSPDNADEMWAIAGDEVSPAFLAPGKFSDDLRGSVDHGALYHSTDGGRSWSVLNAEIPSARAVVAA